MDAVARAAVLRALCFHRAWGYPPTPVEVCAQADVGRGFASTTGEAVWSALARLIEEGVVRLERGRVVFAGDEALIPEHEMRERLFSRKLRAARRVAAYLARLGGVRFVALCNTTALAHARDGGDLDFFVITAKGTLWQTRGMAMLPFAVLGRRPRHHEEVPDAVCFSFFVDDTSLDLAPFQLAGDDPYFRYWFLSLIPLVDDGVSAELWAQNQMIRARHPLAGRWMGNPEVVRTPVRLHVPRIPVLDPLAFVLQKSRLPPAIRARMNQDSAVRVTPQVFKSHVEDGRVGFRDAYAALCDRYAIDP